MKQIEWCAAYWDAHVWHYKTRQQKKSYLLHSCSLVGKERHTLVYKFQNNLSCSFARTVVGEAPDIGEIDGESDDGQEKVDLFVPRLARLTFRRQSSRHRWLIQRRRLADDAGRRAIIALRALPVFIVKRFGYT